MLFLIEYKHIPTQNVNMLVKLNGNYIRVYKDNFKYKFELTVSMEPYFCYLAKNSEDKYIYVDYDDEYNFNIPQNKIRNELKKN